MSTSAKRLHKRIIAATGCKPTEAQAVEDAVRKRWGAITDTMSDDAFRSEACQVYRSPYLIELEAITARFEAEVTALAAKVRTDLVVPACNRYHLSFSSGMGKFNFENSSGETYGDVGDLDDDVGYFHRDTRCRLSPAATDALRPILTLLNTEVAYAQYLAYYVEDVPAPAKRTRVTSSKARKGKS